MKTFKTCIWVVAALLIATSLSYGQDVAVASATPVAPVATEEAPEVAEDQDGTFTFSGYLDTYFFANLNSPSSRNNLGSSGISRGFDRY
jgi:hypothetical protein